LTSETLKAWPFDLVVMMLHNASVDLTVSQEKKYDNIIV
jgi:hypothetical protein